MKSLARTPLLCSLALLAWLGARLPEATGKSPGQAPVPAQDTSADSGLAGLPAAELQAAEGLSDPLLRCGDGLTITRQEYAEYLLAISGRRPLQDLLRQRLYEREAQRLGLVLDDAALVQEAEARLTALLETRHRGDEAALAAELEASGFDLKSYRQVLLGQLQNEALEARLVVATRPTDEDTLRKRFEREYGPGGQRTRLRHLMLTRAQLRADLIAAGEPAEGLTLERLDARMQALLAQYRAELEGGADFAALAQRVSHDAPTRGKGGAIGDYRAPQFGPSFASAVAGAPIGQLIGPLESPSGWHLLLVEERLLTRFEDVREALLQRQLSDPANAEERFLLRQRLEGNCQPEYL
jgi:parvulin-like peptidyl-prolyl isomerase